ncbi:MAG: S41 family peptidase [Candidatus Paceibacterota bacterium]|jgi:carboxyl-terminal processing protease
MTTSTRSSLAAILFIAIAGSFLVGFSFGRDSVSSESQVLSVINKVQSETGTTTADFAAFWKAWNVLDEKFAGTSTPPEDRVWGAIEGMTATFGDPYTVFFPPEESKIFEDEISGSFEGVGMEVGVKDGHLIVVAPLRDTPAERAGMRSGDLILKIDETDAATLPVDAAVKLIRGKRGTTVRILVERAGTPTPFEVPIVRDIIETPTIKTGSKPEVAADGTEKGAGLRSDGIFVIELYSFSANSANLFRNALKEFVESGSHKLVIDLRGNPGGYLDAAIDMASWFLPSGKVVVREEFGKDAGEQVHRSKGYDVFGEGLRLVILVNGGSASASEILAGALHDHGRATLVGTKTFGKGSVQELVKITPDTSLKVTIAKWLTPDGVSISKQGITPDYVVDFTQKDLEAKKDPQMDKAVELLSKEP